jgi:hypothetical protein
MVINGFTLQSYSYAAIASSCCPSLLLSSLPIAQARDHREIPQMTARVKWACMPLAMHCEQKDAVQMPIETNAF